MQSYCTAWFALHHRAKAKAGEWLLVLGAGGGVGLAAVDVGRAMGLHVDRRGVQRGEARTGDGARRGGGHRHEHRGREGPRQGAQRRGSGPRVRPGRRGDGRSRPAQPARRRPAARHRLRRRRDPAAAGQPDPAAQPTGHRCRLGRLDGHPWRGEPADARRRDRRGGARRAAPGASRARIRSPPSPRRSPIRSSGGSSARRSSFPDQRPARAPSIAGSSDGHRGSPSCPRWPTPRGDHATSPSTG